jgi:hypothetical protein
MHLIIGIGAAVALLYYWLLGHWFARVLTTIVFVPAFALLGAVLFMVPHNNAPGVFGAILGAAIAWPAASAPVWYWRRVLGINS